MSRDPSPHEAFDWHKSPVLSIAYRMLGGVAEGRIHATSLVLDPGKPGGVSSLERFEKEVSGWAMRRSS
jgi:hypothetical protein